MAWIVVAAIVGVVLGWIIRGLGVPKRRDVEDIEDRLRRSERRIRSVATERDNEHSEVLTLRAALRSERQLLDSVAGQNQVDPEVFRKTVSREYLGRELVVSPASLIDTRFRPGDAALRDAVLSGGQDERIAELEAELANRDAQLSQARDQIHRIRADVESLAGARREAPVNVMAVSSGPAQMNSDAPTNRPTESTSAAGTIDAPAPDPTIDLRSEDAVIDLCEAAPASGQTSVSAEHLSYLEGRAASVQALEREVASLRERLADLTVEHDDVRSRIDYRRGFDARIEQLVDELESVRTRLVAERDEIDSPVLDAQTGRAEPGANAAAVD